MEASKRAAPGDTLKELSAILQSLGDESPRGVAPVLPDATESSEFATDPPGSVVTPPPESPEDGRGRGGRSCASRRAAPREAAAI